MFHYLTLLFVILATSCSLHGQGVLSQEKRGSLLYLEGTPYELGFQHGRLLKEGVAKNIERFVDQKILAYSSQPAIKAFLDHLPILLSHVPPYFMEELKGLAEGSEQPLDKILLLNLFPEMIHCSGLTVSGEATANRSLYHVRVLDYAVGQSLQDTATVMVVKPKGKIPFLNVSYAGFIGSITGMNGDKITLGEIGGKGYGYWNGMPMAFLLRDILERASTLQDVKDILTSTPRTCEYYFIFSDGKVDQSFAAYATASQLHFINPGESYALLAPGNAPQNYGKEGFDDKFFLANYHFVQSPYQIAIYEDERKQLLKASFYRQPKDCLVVTGYSCPAERYSLLMERLAANYGSLKLSDLQEAIKRPVARDSNLHNAIFSPTTLEAWISHAGTHNEPACDQPYHYFSLVELLKAQK